MRFYEVRFRLARSLVALAVSASLFLSCVSAFAGTSKSSSANLTPTQTKPNGSPELEVTTVTASAGSAGVSINWTTSSTRDNLGFNVYRITNGQRTRINREIIPGALLATSRPDLVRGGYSYSWFDSAGTPSSSYAIESVNVNGVAKLHSSIRAVASGSGNEQKIDASRNAVAGSASENLNSAERSYPAAQGEGPNVVGSLEDQWAIVGQSALKISIKKDGWYRVTQPQMVAAGFNPTVDIRNLRLFEGGNEVAINTSQFNGAFSSGDFIEFFGRGFDTATTDLRVYYLIAGTTAGKRVGGELHLDGPTLTPGPTSTPVPPITPTQPGTPAGGPVLRDPIFYSWATNSLNVWADVKPKTSPDTTISKDAARAEPGFTREARADNRGGEVAPSFVHTPENLTSENPRVSGVIDRKLSASAGAAGLVIGKSLKLPALSSTSSPRKPAVKASAATARKKKQGKKRRPGLHRHHALVADGFAPANFESTLEVKDRIVYIANILNGDEDNWFGRVIASTPVNQNLTISNLDTSAAVPARLDFALQGIMSQFGFSHSVNVTMNGHAVGTVSFDAIEHAVRSFSIPINQLQNGANTLTFTKTTTGEVCSIDYIRLTYPHSYKADNGSLKFNLRGTQSLKVDGFATSLVKLIDYTDPLAVTIHYPTSELTPNGFALEIPKTDPPNKDQRLLLALPDGQFEQPAALSLNQPSTLNASSNAGSFLIISHKNFIPDLSANITPVNTSLVAQRTSQGFSVYVADIDDVYDEFSYGIHGPQAIKNFVEYALTHWATPPQFVLFVGDSSLDPKNYLSSVVDYVPTKLVDATFNETCSDDWLTDFDGDGIANIPVGRLPVRTNAEANLILSKIVNFAPASPENAMLVADDPTGYYFNFETANDEVQSLLPPAMTVQRVNVRTESSPAQAKANVIAGFNQGRALVNYTGHGNVDVWASSSIFTAADASALTNGTKLSFVVVMDCLNGYFHDPNLLSLSEALLKAPNGGAVAGFASSGLTFPDGQHEMSQRLYTLIYGGPQISLGAAIKDAKGHTFDIDVRRTWIYFGDPSLKIR